jgi:hypothetical protein
VLEETLEIVTERELLGVLGLNLVDEVAEVGARRLRRRVLWEEKRRQSGFARNASIGEGRRTAAARQALQYQLSSGTSSISRGGSRHWKWNDLKHPPSQHRK